ncbi:MAG: hypothetical protein AAF597_08965, partial [Bacteroidota bacterium]
KLEDAKRGLITLSVIHLCFTLFFVVAGDTILSGGSRAQLCLAIATGGIFAYKSYDWRNSLFNVIIVMGYIGLLLIEWFSLGLPEPALKVSPAHTIGKGSLLELAVQFTPSFYAVLRIALFALLINTMLAAYRINTLTNRFSN